MKKSTIFLIGFVLLVMGGGLTYRYFVRDTDSRGATKLMRAIENNEELKNTSKLIAKTQDINVRDKKGQTALLYAVRHSQEADLVRNLLNAGADAQTSDNQGYTPILVAAKNNPSPEIIRLLTLYGGDVNAPGPDGLTPLELAAQHNTGPVLETLLRSNADLKTENGPVENLILGNAKLSETEKANYRQLLLILSILEDRANAKALATAGTEIAPQEIGEPVGPVIPEPAETADTNDTAVPAAAEDEPATYFCENCDVPAEDTPRQ